MSVLQKKLTTLVEPLLASLGLELWGLEFLPSNRSLLRIYIVRQAPTDIIPGAASTDAENASVAASADSDTDIMSGLLHEAHPKDAGIDECSRAARLIGLTLDVEDIIDGSYVMEVSTPGLERLFFSPEQLAAYAGELVDLSLHSNLPSHPGRKRFAGRVSVQNKDGGRFSLKLLNPAELTPENADPLEFSWEDIKKVRLIYMAPEKPNAPKPKQAKQKKNAAKQDATPQE